ncbi:hypothetical protein GUITHDRAFT_82670 [Guillardia theta CCMP2712]|uniref:Myosin motor domain-containing protein n=1 Tax=Guillardia theta (strain CCMP2712) TaxID=905079 RepID=L1I7C1_GUITC|nr:hypothetical protein GUITHDRAFT_82670 [Guillardia theta CCMP2712]EKX31977.1 hypothetical protein GUITHDRAFT_82670 [Guillardia theta CCMP2712]|eukprot:XP_005818957.1 hypothetical protein GUITHDRAFT_82670 [Guillardia theta CCMP2712]
MFSFDNCSRAVWLRDSKQVWVEGEVLGSGSAGRLRCRTSEGEVREVEADHVALKNPRAEQTMADLTSLTQLDEPNVLFNLQSRFLELCIYTWTGPILLAVNPWHTIEGLYSRASMASFIRDRQRRLSPHVYSVAHRAYESLSSTQRSQSILVSGESGSGKTETTKHLLQYLAASSSHSSSPPPGEHELSLQHMSMEQQVLLTNPILEAFGNAKTVRNDNSSRFGKLLILQFQEEVEQASDARRMRMCGAKIETYLLEKSRVVRQGGGESNYHIFEALRDSLLARSPASSSRLPPLPPEIQLGLGVQDFRILGSSSSAHPVVSPPCRLLEVYEALASIGVSDQQWLDLTRVLLALLHLGNCDFMADTSSSSTSDVDTARLRSSSDVEVAARLLGCEEEELVKGLLERRVKTVEESVTICNSREKAETARDSLMKALYGLLFHWIVSRVNDSLATPTGRELRSCSSGSSSGSSSGRRDGSRSVSIGVLDIFGFELLERNGFEQLCINYANEKLQLQFNEFVFKEEQEEYRREGIPWELVSYKDNQPCIDLIEGRAGGLLALLDEECRVPRGSDDGFVSKARGMQQEHLKAPKREREAFAILHYAGEVCYSSRGFVDTNRDLVSQDLLALLGSSRCSLLSHMMQVDKRAGRSSMPGRRREARQETIASEFKQQLTCLTASLVETDRHYVRCLNSNALKLPHKFDKPLVAHQLRCNGVVEAVRVVRAGFTGRYGRKEFESAFASLAGRRRGGEASTNEAISDVLR